MDNLIQFTKTSVYPAIEVAENVSNTMPVASFGTIRLIGLVLIIMMFILTILTISLICIEIRQDTLRKLIYSMSQRLERMENIMIETHSDGADHASS